MDALGEILSLADSDLLGDALIEALWLIDALGETDSLADRDAD